MSQNLEPLENYEFNHLTITLNRKRKDRNIVRDTISRLKIIVLYPNGIRSPISVCNFVSKSLTKR